MYFQLASNIADAVELLTEAQQKGENGYLEAENQESIGLGAQVQAGEQNLEQCAWKNMHEKKFQNINDE